MSKAETILFGAYGALPAGTNVFAVVAEAVKEGIYPPLPHSYTVQLFTLLGIFCLLVPLFLAAIFIRARKTRQYLPFHLYRSPQGVYVAPHFVLCWQVVCTSFLVLLIGYAQQLSIHAKGERIHGYLLWVMVPWVCEWVAAFLTIWSLAVALAAPGMEDEPWALKLLAPAVLNTFFLALLIICPALVGAIAGVAQNRYAKMVDAFEDFHAAAMTAAATFSPTSTDAGVREQLAQLVEPLDVFFHRQAEQDLYFRSTWAVYVVIDTLLLLTTFIVAIRYFRSLSKQLKHLKSFPGSRTTSSNGSFKHRLTQADPRRAIHNAYWDMVFTTVAITCGGFFYVGLSIALCSLGSDRANDRGPIQALSLVSLYISAVVGAPTSVLSLYRAVQLPPPSAQGSSGRPSMVTTIGSIGGARLKAPHDRDAGRETPDDVPAFRIDVLRTVEVSETGKEDEVYELDRMQNRR
ncbi:hypothetical protein JCM10207_002322 [Rhodosporidiobolus poonsookiae]